METILRKMPWGFVSLRWVDGGLVRMEDLWPSTVWDLICSESEASIYKYLEAQNEFSKMLRSESEAKNDRYREQLMKEVMAGRAPLSLLTPSQFLELLQS